MFCSELQKLLKPIYDLTRKGRHFIWREEQQEAFEEIKRMLVKAPVLHMPNHEGRFHLYTDMSKFAAGSALYQIQNGKPRLIKPATTRIKGLLELICSYSFNLHYMKGKHMVLSDFLSRQKHDNSDPHEIISISFNMYNTL